ncbi:KRP95, partial [Symbiodinium sp. KB8]
MCSYLQVYNGRVFDLLADPARSRPLHLREGTDSGGSGGGNGAEDITGGEGAARGVYVAGLSEYRVASLADVLDLLATGTRNRARRATEHNEASSRSHAVLRLAVTLELRPARQAVVRRAVLSLVDLAGSEKWDTRPGATRMTAGRQRELTAINTSLSALGNCISALVRKRQRDETIRRADVAGSPPPRLPPVHVPYRDSPLTRLLQDSLGGNCRTVVVATVGPSAAAAEESLSTLHFADRARRVLVRVRVNEVVDDRERLARSRREVARLKRALKAFIAVYGGTFDGPFGKSGAPPVGWKPPTVVVVARGAAVAPVLTADPGAAVSGRFRGSAAQSTVGRAGSSSADASVTGSSSRGTAAGGRAGSRRRAAVKRQRSVKGRGGSKAGGKDAGSKPKGGKAGSSSRSKARG